MQRPRFTNYIAALKAAYATALPEGRNLEVEYEQLYAENLRVNSRIAAHNAADRDAPGFAAEEAGLERDKLEHARQCADLNDRRNAHKRRLDRLTILMQRAGRFARRGENDNVR